MDANSAQRATTSNNLSQYLKNSGVTPGLREATSRPLMEDMRGASLPASNRPLKQVKLEDGGVVPAHVIGFPPKQVKLEGTTFSAAATARTVPNVSSSANESIRPEVQPVEKQTLQVSN